MRMVWPMGTIAILLSAAMTRHIILKFSFMKLSKDLHSLLLFYAFFRRTGGSLLMCHDLIIEHTIASTVLG